MVIFPLIILIQPLLTVLTEAASASNGLAHEHVLLYMLAIPALVPAALASYSVVGERQQGTLEPVLATPIRREEFLLGKALAAFVPSLAISYAVLAFFLSCVELFAHPGIAQAVLRAPDLLALLPLHATPRRMVDLGRHRDLGQIERRTRCRAAQPARESPVGRSDNAHRVQRDPRHARPGRRRSSGTPGPRRTRLADHLGGVRPRTPHHQHPLTRRDHFRASPAIR
jgi:ABC-2 family transporter